MVPGWPSLLYRAQLAYLAPPLPQVSFRNRVLILFDWMKAKVGWQPRACALLPPASQTACVSACLSARPPHSGVHCLQAFSPTVCQLFTPADVWP